MRKFLIPVTIIAMAMGFAVFAGKASAHDHGPPPPPPAKATFCVDGSTVMHYSHDILVGSYTYEQVADNGGYYSFRLGPFTLYSLHAPDPRVHPQDVTWVPVADHACATAPGQAPQTNNAFDCYNADSPPEVFNVDVVTALLAAGQRTAPIWVSGNVAGGTNIGSGHLVCSMPSGMKWDGKTIVNMDGYSSDGTWGISNGNIVVGGLAELAIAA